jgi:hypothetical protein
VPVEQHAGEADREQDRAGHADDGLTARRRRAAAIGKTR